MTTSEDPASRERVRREALLAEYAEVAGNFRLLTDIRFKLLALLPIATVAATAALSAGGRDAAAEVRTLALSVFGLLVTIALATYNDRNDQLYNELVGRASSIERQVGLPDGAFANRPTAWFSVPPSRGLSWPVNHRNPVAWIYGASVALWLASCGVAIVQLSWGGEGAPWWALLPVLALAALLPWLAARRIGEERRARQERMRLDAAEAVRLVLAGNRLSTLATNERFVELCGRLGGVKRKDAVARTRFYSAALIDDAGRFALEAPAGLRAAHLVALVADLPAEWIDDCARGRRKALPRTVGRRP